MHLLLLPLPSPQLSNYLAGPGGLLTADAGTGAATAGGADERAAKRQHVEGLGEGDKVGAPVPGPVWGEAGEGCAGD